jgi:asparagine synthase (glutamine-hydrolysing)
MCGINGFNFSSEELIRKMNEKVKHRGPDGDGVFVCDKVSFGHTRLAIIDLSDKASQPMFSEDNSIVLIFNGEIYNFQDLRKELREKGYKFNSNSDSEVIVNSYREFGVDCVKKINGIFAFAIYDKRDDSVFIARDRVGVKPLYYYWDNNPSANSGQGKFIFSSEIKAILEHGIKKEVDIDALNIYFRTLYVPAPFTMFRGVKKLEPGSYLIYKNNKLENKKYWQPNDFSNIEEYDDAKSQIEKLMKDSVRLQLISDRPVGVFLSGGVDSTVITGLVSEITKSKVKTFSCKYDVDSDKFNSDAKLAKQTSEHYGTDHQEILITGRDAKDNLFDVFYHMDEPVSNTTQIATYILSKHTKEKVAVVLGGDGGDELFGGYERYKLSRMISEYQNDSGILKKILGNLFIKIGSIGIPSLSKMKLPPDASRYLSFMAQKEKDLVFLKSGINNSSITKDFYQEKYFSENNAELNKKDFEKMFMWADVRSWLVDESLMRSDKMSMAYGLEQRVPILDHRLVELSLKIPTNWKIRGTDTKAIFKDAMKSYIPDYVLKEPKRGWFSPTSIWLRNDLKDIVYEVLSPEYNKGAQEFFDFEKIKQMLDDHIDSKAYHMNLLWALLTFQIWYKKFFDI